MKELYDDNSQKVVDAVKEIITDDQKFKQVWAKQCKQWVAFANGDQRVDTATGAAPVINNSQPQTYNYDRRQNMYTTNEIDPIVRTLAAYMCRSKPSVECFPSNFESEEERNAAKIAEMVHNAKYEIDDEYMNSRKSAFWALVTGNVYAKDYWNPEKGLVIDEFGRRAGDNDVAILSALSITTDNSCLDFQKQPYIIESYYMETDWAKVMFDQQEAGYTGKTNEIKNESGNVMSIDTLEDMKYSIPFQGYQNSSTKKGKTLVQEIYIKPSFEWPKGRLLITAGDVLVYDSPREEGSPYFMPYDEEMWHPYTYFGYEPYVGRALHKGVVEPIMPLQLRLNEINGSILENANTLAKPNILAAINQLKKGVINGKGAMVYTYSPIPNAPAPTTIGGTPLPAQFFQEKKEIIEHMVRIAGTNFVMSGQPPSGVSAASAISQLLENATTQQSDIMKAWETYHQSRYQKKLRIIHKFMRYPNNKLNDLLRQLNKNLLEKQVNDFVGQQDLSAGTVLKIQYASMLPKSELTKREMYDKWAKDGLLGPITEPTPAGAKLRSQLLERFGEKPLESEESVELKKAKWENDRVKQGLPVEVSPYDKAEIHLPCHIGEIQDPNYLEKATDEQKLALDDHIKAHQQVEAEKAQAQMMQQAQMAQIAQANEATKTPQTTNSKGVPQ